jgi:hypothetical protein
MLQSNRSEISALLLLLLILEPGPTNSLTPPVTHPRRLLILRHINLKKGDHHHDNEGKESVGNVS